MKHVGSAALDRLEPLLAGLRKIEALKERSRGVFYRSGRAFLHFHEHGCELFADLRLGKEFQRLPATTAAHWTELMKTLSNALRE